MWKIFNCNAGNGCRYTAEPYFRRALLREENPSTRRLPRKQRKG